MKNLSVLIPLLFAANSAYSAVQQVNFTMSDGAGNNATGFITYDDNVVGNGDAIAGGGLCGPAPDNSINYVINISGGSLGSVTFDKSTCATPPAFCDVPDFQVDVNFFSCTSGGATGSGTAPNTFSVTNGAVSADLVFQTISAPQPATVASIPSLSTWGMIFLASLMAFFTMRSMRRQG